MSSDRLIEFEEQNWDWLADKFIDKYIDEWEEFVYGEYEKNMPDFMEE